VARHPGHTSFNKTTNGGKWSDIDEVFEIGWYHGRFQAKEGSGLEKKS